MILMVKFFFFFCPSVFDAWPVSFAHLKGLVYDILHFMTVIFLDIFTQIKLLTVILVSLACHILLVYSFVFLFEKNLLDLCKRLVYNNLT